MSVDQSLLRHVVATTDLDESEARRVIDDVVAYLREPVEDYVRRRHHDLKLTGTKNPEIFATISAELRERVVAAPDLTERQIRRLVYG